VNPLSAQNPVASFRCGDFTATYSLSELNHLVGLRLLPLEKADAVKTPRVYLETPEVLALPLPSPLRASNGETSFVQLKLAEDGSTFGFGAGRTMRNNPTVEALRFRAQTVAERPDGFTVTTELTGSHDFICQHILTYRDGDQAVTVETRFTNTGSTPLTLEMLSSFEMSGISPFDSEDCIERLNVHRFRSFWSAEGRHEQTTLEGLHLERSWSSWAVINERFGQVGSMPVRGFFPFVAIEDKLEGVFWGAQLACPSSWQIEVYRREDKLSLSGGLADREFGHWMKRITPGESFTTPQAYLSTGTGTFDSFCQRLVRMQSTIAPAIEESLPILFNEWCSSWGWPTPGFIEQTASRLTQTPTRVFVIDDGWAEKGGTGFQINGDWNVELKRFPDGLRPVTEMLNRMGFIAGLWFEFEVCTEGSKAFALTDHKLQRDGKILKVGSRHFWDFTDPWTIDYLTEKVIHRLRDDGFGYLKVDYNDTIGLGCDHPDSLGEGLRLHIAGVQEFFRRIRAALPDLIIEVCSSGGHRLEPSMLELGAMGSFSDAHESSDIPIIAANLHRLILPRKSQIWAVIHYADTTHRIHYSLAACFLGRACLSGEIATLSDEQFGIIQSYLSLYETIAPIIRDGESTIHRAMNESYRRPRGWQAVVRHARPDANECLCVLHSFGESTGENGEAPLGEGPWQIVASLGSGIGSAIEGGKLAFQIEEPFSSAVLHLRRVP
jgi:alpha-galactosidase